MLSLGKIGDNLFILITGYFCFTRSNLKIKEKTKKVLLQLVFVVITLVLGSTIYNYFVDHSFYNLVGINIFNYEFWFIGYYLLIIIIGQLFLNKKINSLSKEKFTTLIVVMTALVSLVFPSQIFVKITSGLDVLLSGLYFYILGGYIKKYNPFKRIRGYALILLMLIVFGLIALSYRNNTISMINYINALNQVTEQHQIYFTGYIEYSVSCIVISVIVFELFRRMNIKNNKIINYISASTFMIYLIHDNAFGRSLFKVVNWIPMYHDEFGKFVLYLLIVLLIVMILGLILYFIYTMLIKLFSSKKIKSLFLKENN
jgi:surface polysaccharide O-acyltransferase-like enzyme